MKRRLLRLPLLLILTAIAVDRVALYSWSLQLLTAHRRMNEGLTRPLATPLSELRPPFLSLNSDPEHRSVDLLFSGSLLRPDRVTLSEKGTLSLVFLPPSLAWSTFLWPPGASPRTHYAYTFTYFFGRKHSEYHMYRFAGTAGPEVPADARWPHF